MLSSLTNIEQRLGYFQRHLPASVLSSGQWNIWHLRFSSTQINKNMGLPKPLLLLLLLTTIVSTSQKPIVTEARPLSQQSKNYTISLFCFFLFFSNFWWFSLILFSIFWIIGFSEIFSTLGVACKCCDGEKGECTSTWTGSCSKLQCLPWKLN